uniref:myosin heavy chain, clone 203-like n=1 Tax=Styela clava TaxID=7725 RepID=UPI00193957D0|nr:myosin heavy chain, clone 203-like [Styela clava]
MELQKKEHRDIYQEMRLSQDKLNEHYENIKRLADEMKYSFGNVKQREDETELLRQKYYDMLTTKTYSEADRDAYFQLEQTARDEKDLYVLESQKLAYKCSTYVVYSYQHSEKREEFLNKLLQNVDKYYVEYENTKKEKSKLNNHCSQLQNEVQECNSTISRLQNDLRKMEELGNNLEDKCKNYELRQKELLNEKGILEGKNASLTSTLTDTKNRNGNLTQNLSQSINESKRLNEEVEDCNMKISQLNKDIEERKNDQKNLNEKIAYHVENTTELESQLDELKKRSNNMNIELVKNKEELTKIKKHRDIYEQATKQAIKERNKMKEAYDKMKKEKEIMEEQFATMKHDREVVGKEKDRLVSREFRITKRNKELTEDHKFLTREIDELREKYRRADERARKDGSLKQELRDTIKRLHKEMEEERRRMIKVTRDVRIQTDPGLACESRDIAIQHAQFKMKQALKARDQQAVENKSLKESHGRAQKALTKKTNELGSFETKLKTSQENYVKLENKCKRIEKLLNSTKQELEKEKKKLERKKKEEPTRVMLIEQVHLPNETSEVSCQTGDEMIVSEKEAELTLNLALCLQEKVDANKAELADRLRQLERSGEKNIRLEKIIQQQKSENDLLKRKISHMENKFYEERNYMKEIHNSLVTKNLHPRNIESFGLA